MKIEGNSDVGDKTTPKDALVMAAILRDMGNNEYEPRVINQVPDSFQMCARVRRDQSFLPSNLFSR